MNRRLAGSGREEAVEGVAAISVIKVVTPTGVRGEEEFENAFTECHSYSVGF